MTWGKWSKFDDHFFSDGLVQLVQPSTRGSYCWWKKSGDRQLRLVGYPMIYRVLYIPGGCLEIIPSTVWCPRNLSIAEIRVVSNIVSWPNSWHLILKDVFFRYGGILLQFATAKKKTGYGKCIHFFDWGGWSIAFLPVFVSRISVKKIGFFPSSRLHLKKHKKSNQHGWNKASSNFEIYTDWL